MIQHELRLAGATEAAYYKNLARIATLLQSAAQYFARELALLGAMDIWKTPLRRGTSLRSTTFVHIVMLLVKVSPRCSLELSFPVTLVKVWPARVDRLERAPESDLFVALVLDIMILFDADIYTCTRSAIASVAGKERERVHLPTGGLHGFVHVNQSCVTPLIRILGSYKISWLDRPSSLCG